MVRPRLLVSLIALALQVATSRAMDTNGVLSEWFAAENQLQTWSADLVQTRTLKTLTQPLVATGHLWFAKPNLFRWQLGEGPRTVALRQTNELLVVYPLLKRAERYPVAGGGGQWRDALSLLEAGFPRNRAEFNSQFRLLSFGQTNGAWELTLLPNSLFARKIMTQLRIGLATNDFSLVSTALVFSDGSELRNDFTNTVLNHPLDQHTFEWNLGSDFKVTEPLGK